LPDTVALRSPTRPYSRGLHRFDPDSLTPAAWEHVDAVDTHSTDPAGARWPAGTSTLTKLAVWGGSALYLADQAGMEADDTSAMQFSPDALNLSDWDVIRAIEQDRRDAHGEAWPEGITTLTKLSSWAAHGRRLHHERPR
jgi:hypothetical protein